jgi:hypothetical protein
MLVLILKVAALCLLFFWVVQALAFVAHLARIGVLQSIWKGRGRTEIVAVS